MQRTWWIGLFLAFACKSKHEQRETPPPPNPIPKQATKPQLAWRLDLSPGLPVQAVAAHPQGACVVGVFGGTISLGGKAVTAVGEGDDNSDGFVACYSADGKERWAHVLAGPGRDSVRDIAVDKNGDVFILGGFGGLNVAHPPPTPAELAGAKLLTVGGGDMVVARFHADGTLVWAKSIGGSDGELEEGIALTPSGDVIVIGDAYGELEVAGTKLGKPKGQDGFVIALHGNDGATVWALPLWGHTGTHAVAVGPDGSIFVGGYFVGPLTIGGKEYPNAGNEDAFIASIAPDGTARWVQTIDSQGKEGVSGLAADATGLYAVGWFSAEVTVSGAKYAPKGEDDGYLMKLALDGTPAWFHPWGGGARDDLKSVAIGADAILAAGSTGGEQHEENMKELPGTPVTVLGPSDGAMVAFTRDGAPMWTQTFGGRGRDWANDVALDASGAVYVVGKSDERGVFMMLR